jgi:hydrogenase-4 component C
MIDANGFLIGLFQALLLLLAAPLFSGLSRVLRAKMHNRRGPGVLQNYRDLVKLIKRQQVVPAQASGVFQITPYVLMSTMLLIAMIIPILTLQSPLGRVGDLILVIYLFALARFFYSLAGLDSGNGLAGIAANREMSLAILIEPVMLLVLFVVALLAGSTDLGTISRRMARGEIPFHAAVWLGMAAFAFAALIEMGKLPFDLAEAEQELQEGPQAEYSGHSLALIKWSLYLKQLLVIALFVSVFLPFGGAAGSDWLALMPAGAVFGIKALFSYLLLAVLENGMARVRFLKASEVTWVVFGTALLSFVFYLANV